MVYIVNVYKNTIYTVNVYINYTFTTYIWTGHPILKVEIAGSGNVLTVLKVFQKELRKLKENLTSNLMIMNKNRSFQQYKRMTN